MSISFRLISFLILLATAPLSADSFYVDAGKGNDTNDGSRDKPFKTISAAVAKVDGFGGTVHLSAEGGPYRETLFLKKGGTRDQPLIIEGHDSVINLGVDVTQGPWFDTGYGFRLEPLVIPNKRVNLVSPVFVNGLPLFTDKPNAVTAKAGHGGTMSYDDQNHLILVFPKGLSPANAVVVASAPEMVSGVSISGGNHIVIRDLTVLFAGNDGFNIHGKCEDIILQRVRALFNSDQGISAHETSQVTAVDSEVAFNGTWGGSIADIMETTTTYRNLRIHQNRNEAFQFQQGHHLLENVISYDNGGHNLPFPSASIQLIDCQDLGALNADAVIPTVSGEVVTHPYSPGKAAAEAKKTYDDKDRLGRFLQFRPPATPLLSN